MTTLKRVFDPSVVAVIGATEKQDSPGRAVLENLLQLKDRKVFPVNPSRETILGIPCVKNVKDIGEPIDLAVIVTPAATVPQIVEECGQAGVQGALIISSGFRETGEEGKALEGLIEESRKKYGMRIVGPNCLGLIRPSIGLNATFLKLMPEPGKIAFISHSSALASAILDWAIEARIGFSMLASLGCMIDVDFGDLIDYLGDDPQTKSIMIYMEDVGHAKKFMSAARGFARAKPIIVLKPGRYREPAGGFFSAKGAVTGEDEVYDAAFKRAGVVRVEGIDDLFNCAAVLDSKHLPAGNRLAVITNARGPDAITTDWLFTLGGELANLSGETSEKLDGLLPKSWSHENPINVLGDADIERYTKTLTICLNDPNVDGALLIYTPQGEMDATALAKAVVAAVRRAPKPVVTTFMGGKTVAKAREVFLQNNIPTYATPEEAVRTYLYMYMYQRNLESLYETPAELPVEQSPPKNSLKVLIRNTAKEGRRTLTEEESKRFLVSYKIPSTLAYAAHNVEEALKIARRIGFPVVLKIASPDIAHKTDVGGVALDVGSEKQLEEKYGEILRRVGEAAPSARIEGISVQRMVERVDYELILGTRKDKDFGSVILFGMGGVATEVFRDFSIGLPPLNQTLAMRLVDKIRASAVMTGLRGKKPVNLMKLEQLIVSYANLVADFPEIEEMDVNPIAVAQGNPIALDARIAIDPSYLDGNDQPLYPHLVITPYPTRYITPYNLSDGVQVLLRPIRPEDEPLEYEMLASLSPESVRGRFFQSIKSLGHSELTRFCNIDYEREIAFVAELREASVRKMIGVGRIIMESDMKSGEFALLTHDDYQGKGLGYKLLDMLIGVAQEKKLEMLYGVILSDNHRMLSLCRNTGFRSEPREEGLTRVELLLR